MSRPTKRYPFTSLLQRDPASAEHERPSRIWLISFTDLVCLLLAFFVLLFSMREPVAERWQALVGGLGLEFGRRSAGGGAVFNAGTIFPPSALALGYLAPLLSVQFQNHPELKGIAVEREADRLVIGLPDHLLFTPEDPAYGLQFSSQGERIIFVLSGILGRLGNRIEVAAHALAPAYDSDAPPGGAGEAGEAGWETALVRAVAVAGALREAGYRRPLVARSRAGAETADGRPRSHLIDVVIREREGP